MKPKKLQANQPRTAKPTGTTDRQGLISSNRFDCLTVGCLDTQLGSSEKRRMAPRVGRLRHASALEPKWMPWQQPTESHGSATKVRMRQKSERQGKDDQRRASTGGPTPRDDGIRGLTGL